jgi:creatinine amidohydrolase
VIRDVLVELYRQKAKKIVVLNGHYENIWPIIEGIEMALDAIDRNNCESLNIVRIDHWELLSSDTLARVFPNGYPGIELEHASVIETSMMLALRPELVDLTKAMHDGPAKFRPYDRYPEPPDEVPASGVLSLTEGSAAEKSNWLLDDCLEKIVQIVRDEFSTN